MTGLPLEAAPMWAVATSIRPRLWWTSSCDTLVNEVGLVKLLLAEINGRLFIPIFHLTNLRQSSQRVSGAVVSEVRNAKCPISHLRNAKCLISHMRNAKCPISHR